MQNVEKFEKSWKFWNGHSLNIIKFQDKTHSDFSADESFRFYPGLKKVIDAQPFKQWFEQCTRSGYRQNRTH